MLGSPDPTGEFANLMRLYMTLHCDHEGGNVSAFAATPWVPRFLTPTTPSLPASMVWPGLAWLANQECLHFVLGVREQFGGVPTDEQLRDYAGRPSSRAA